MKEKVAPPPPVDSPIAGLYLDPEEPTQVKTGTTASLIEALTHPAIHDAFVGPFLLTLDSLSDPSTVLTHVLAAFSAQPLRVLRVLQQWVSSYWCDFRDNAELRDALEQFCDHTLVESGQDPECHLRAWIDKMDRADRGLVTSTQRLRSQARQPPETLRVKAPSHVLRSALDFHPVELARQLTLVDEELYKSVEPREATGQAWTKNNGVNAPNLLKLINRFNAVSDWVTSEIFTADGRQAAMITHFIDVADALRDLNNFQSTMAVLGGLAASSVARLKPFWADIPSKQRELHDELSTLTSLTSNMKNLSDHLQTVAPPAIPYVGLYLGHLTFIDEGNPNNIDGLVNFSKRRQVTATVFQMCRFQIVSYELAAVPEIQAHIDEWPRIGESDAYINSLLLVGRRVGEFKTPRRWRSAPLALDDSTPRSRSLFADPRMPPLALRDSNDRLQVATLMGLVATLTDPHVDDFGGKLSTAFLSFYRSVATARVVLWLLRARYQTPACKHTSSDRVEKYNTKLVVPLRQRVARIFQYWIGKYWLDFFGQNDCADTCRALLNEMQEPYMANIVSSLHQMLDARQRQYNKLRRHQRALITPEEEDSSDTEPEQTVLWSTALLAASPTSTAHCLAAMAWDAMSHVQCFEIFEAFSDAPDGVREMRAMFFSGWNDIKLSKRAPACLHPMLELHFALSHMVVLFVCSGMTIGDRTIRLTFLINVAKEARKLHSFATVDAIVRGLCDPRIDSDAFPCAWNRVARGLVVDLAALSADVSTEGENGTTHYREAIRGALPPGVPLVRVVVDDIGEAMAAAMVETHASLLSDPALEADILSAEAENASPAHTLDVARRAHHQIPKSLTSILAGSTVSPPARIEQHSVVHVHAWQRASSAAVDFGRWQESTYDVKVFAPHRDAVMNVLRGGLLAEHDEDEFAARIDAIRGEERDELVNTTPAERELHTLINTVFDKNPDALNKVAAAIADAQDKMFNKHRDGLRTLIEKSHSKSAAIASSGSKRLVSLSEHLGENMSAWAEPSAPIDLLAKLFPDAVVTMSDERDTDARVYAWDCDVSLPVVRAETKGAFVELCGTMAEEDTTLVAVCKRRINVAHVGTALRAAKLLGGRGLVVTHECTPALVAVAKQNGVCVLVVA